MIKVYFSNIRPQIINELKKAKKNITVAVYWFTNFELFESLMIKLNQGLEVSLIIHNDYINNRETGLNFQNFIDNGGKFYFSDNYNPMHNKFCIIDSKVLINGSYNWTYYAEIRNSENILIIKRETKIIKAFIEEFNRIITLSEIVEKITTLSQFEINDSRMIGTRDYFAKELLYQAKGQNKPTIVERAIEISQNNIDIQIIACDLNLRPKLKLIHSIGASLHNDKYLILLPIGTIIPFKNSKIVNTVEDNQTSVYSKILYGENPVASKNIKIGEMRVNYLPPRPAGQTELRYQITIDLKANLKIEKVSIDNPNNKAVFQANISDHLTPLT
jgi:hypothetical protein